MNTHGYKVLIKPGQTDGQTDVRTDDMMPCHSRSYCVAVIFESRST